VLDFVSSKAHSVVVILCRRPCSAQNSLIDTNWNDDKLIQLIKASAFEKWIVNVLTDAELLMARRVSATEISVLGELWKSNKIAAFQGCAIRTKSSKL